MAPAGLGIAFGDESDAADVAVDYFVGITAWVVGDMVRGQRERAALLVARRGTRPCSGRRPTSGCASPATSTTSSPTT